MRKSLVVIAVMILSLATAMGQRQQVTLPANGDWPETLGDSVMLIGPKQDALSEKQVYFNPPYLLVYPGKEHLKEQMIRACACDCDPSKPNRRIGVFSVAEDRQVSFSQGNLQYLPAANLWKFADTQYEYLGNANKYISSTFRNWVDLFGWSANNTTAPFGVSTSTNAADYAGDFVDWGTNTICGDAPGTWRTMSADEWEFLLEKRKNASNLYSVAKVAGENGLIILPDDWKVPEGIIFKAGLHSSQVNDFSVYQSFTADEWKVMEEAGAVFLHASGYRDGATIEKCNTSGYYWSNTTSNGDDAYRMYFYSYFLGPKDVHSKYRGRSVRLVHDTIVPPPAPCQTFEVKGVTFNMMCVEGEKYDYLMGQTEVTQGLWEQVMGYNNSLFKGEYLPIEKVSWEECQTFIQKLNEMTGKHFRLPTEAEWEYAARGGKNSRGYTYAGSNSIDSVAWYQANSQEQTHTIATLMPNELGIYDMSGNVWEWCQDHYDASAQRVVRGGSFYDVASVCRISSRGGRDANYRSYIGLRLVLDEHEYVDLGLSVMWATTNVGAESAEEFGDYFAWGETEPKEVYDWSTYKWFDGTANNMTKYNPTDGLTTLLPEDDAAHVNWGGEWRMATADEQKELMDQCTWIWVKVNNIGGYKVVGPNGNHIFLPAAGYMTDQSSYANVMGYQWASTVKSGINAYRMHFGLGEIIEHYSGGARNCGASIRPVIPTDREILTPSTPGRRIGVFSVAKDKQVSFSQGNLQYIQSANLWRFAENQYEYLGEENVKDGQLANRIDLFGWSGKDNNAPFGVSTSTNNADYAGEFVDWGTNIIQGDVANTWRTLSKEEWEYLIKGRKNASNLRAAAQVNGVNGMILLPDDWECPEGIDFKAGYHTSKGSEYYAEYQQFTKEQWRELETTGAIFLPAAGMHDGNGIADIQAGGYYWSATDNGDTYAYTLISQSSGAYLTYDNRYDVRSVRLVHDTIVPPPAPCETFKVNGVKFNMMCVEGGTFMMGAAADDTTAEADEKPQHQVTLSDFMIGQTEVTQNLWEAVMGSYPSTIKGDSLPVNNVSWEDCQTFITKLNALTGLYFRLPTEAEWEFAARGGNKSKDFVYAGSDNIDEVAWHIGNSGNMTHPVATKQPNEIGIYDMSGNVWEWCLDWNGDYTADMHTNPQGPTIGEYRMYRGGGWKYADKDCRVTRRRRTASYDKTSLGLRLVLDTHQYVDLGLSVMWATTNVGAESAEEYGDYFAWGETTTKDYYGWSTYKWCKGTDTSLTKYCIKATYGADGFTDGLTTLLPEDDAAHVHWGAMWRMATKSEFQELIDNCRWETTTLNGVKGYRVTSTVPGYTDRSIFLPLAGFLNHDIGNSQKGTTVRYWSSTGNNSSASNLHEAMIEGNTRRIGMSIRPVLPTHRKINIPKAEPGKCIGLFSVGKGKHVTFSQGNLMYLTLKDKWLFAPNQLYYTGERHLKNGQIADTVMYFAWSAKDSRAPWGISTSINLDYYKGEFLDWGTNTIQGDKPDTWRTITDDEAVYLFEGRPNAAQLIGYAEVDGTKGMIVLPDDWQLPEGLSFTPYDATTINHYTLEQWQQMENAGAVIIPAAGYFNNKLSPKMREVGEASFLPYSVLIDSIHQQYSYLRHDKMLQRWPGNNTGNLFYAFPRRLVRDTVVPEYVDMGLSVKWANYNLGASTPTGVGDYYAWGETEPKDSYMPANYQWSMGSAKTYTKYCTVDSMGYNGFTDGLTTLQPQDDAAQMQKGGHWRMPSDAEWEELIKNCTWTQAVQGGQIGYIATSKINGNRIFIPVAGFRSVGNVVLDYLGAYWSSSLNESKQSCAYGLYINKDEDRVGRYSNSCREYGFLIRPVYDENYHAYIDLGLSVYWATFNIGATTPEDYGDYFAWGETEPKETYSWATYKWGTSSNLTKYNTTDGKTVLDLDDDAAYVNWGGNWRMPSKEEVNELTQQCSWIWTTHNNVYGYKVTGPNGNSIFLPAAGYKGAGPTYTAGEDGLYWTITLEKGHYSYLIVLHNDAPPTEASTKGTRCFGFTIRPVYDDVEKRN